MAFQECFDKQCSDAAACEQCMVDRLDTTLASQCTDFSTIMCSYIQTDCPCTNFEKAAERWLQCTFVKGGCPFLCDFPVDLLLDAPVCAVTPSPVLASAQPIVPQISPTNLPTVTPTVEPVISTSTQPIAPQTSSTTLPVPAPTVEPVFQRCASAKSPTRPSH